MDELWITAPDSPDGGVLLDLRQWLADAGELRGVRVSVHRPAPEPETMPGVDLVDALVTMVTDKATVTAVSTAVAGWVTARLSMRRTRLRMRRGDREIEIDTAAVRDLDELARWIRGQLDDEDLPPEQ
jgi:membrane-associated two-gene conflict system component 1 (EACC1)